MRNATVCSDSASPSCCDLCVLLCEAIVPLEDEGGCLAGDIKGEPVDESMTEAGVKREFQSLLNDIIAETEIGDASCSLLCCNKVFASA